jgi:arylsulfatase A-like enzyme
VAPAQAPERRRPVGAAALAATLAASKAVALAGHVWPHTIWAPVVFVWQDLLVVLLFAGLERAVPRAIARLLYGGLVCYVVVNVPVTLALGSPMTATMWRAASPTLADSAWRELTVGHVGAAFAVGAVAVLAWRWTAARPWHSDWRVLAGLVGAVLIGLWATPRVQTDGRERNAFGALFSSPPALAVTRSADSLRDSPFGTPPRDDLRSLAGVGRGLNVVLVVLESTAAHYLRIYGGGGVDPTPTLTALAGRGLVFDHAFAVYPESIRALFAMLCARPPAYDASAEADATLPCRSLADRLSAAGYRTALFHSGRFDYLGMRAIVNHRGFDTLEDAGTIGGAVHSSFGVDERATVDRMLAWVDASSPRRPFFLTYLPIAGHHPYATRAPGPFDGRTAFGQYLNAIREGDEAVGALLEGLRARHLLDRTLLVVCGDHGEAFGQHDGNTGHSLFIYDENVHVPLVMAWPGGTSRRVGRPVSLVDVAPTILDPVGLSRASDADSQSMLDPRPALPFFFTDYSRAWVGVRDGCWKYLLDLSADQARLFDVCVDPGETAERREVAPDRAAQFHARVLEWLAASREGLKRSGQSPSGSW